MTTLEKSSSSTSKFKTERQTLLLNEILIGLCVLLYQVRLVSYLGVLALLCFWSLELEGGGGGKVLLCWYRKNMA